MAHSLFDRVEEELANYVEPPEIEVLRRLRCKLMHDIVPKNLILYLTCLSSVEEDEIKTVEKNEGGIRGALKLLDLIVKKKNWYEDLLAALNDDEVKQGHLATMLNEEQSFDEPMTFGDSYTEEGSNTLGDLKAPPPFTETPSGKSTDTQSDNTEDDVPRGPKLQKLDVDVEPSSSNQYPSTPPPPYSPPRVHPGHGEDRQTGINQQPITVHFHAGVTFNLGEHNSTTGIQPSQANGEQLRESEEERGVPLEENKQADGDTFDKSQDEKQPKDHSAKKRHHSETDSIPGDPACGKEQIGKKLIYEELTPRGYQEELAAPAQRGQNCIICAPTGTGKTHVAIMIAKHHMESSLTEQAKTLDMNLTTIDPSSKLSRKTLFVVNQIHQLNQTYKRLKTFLPLFNIAKRSGASTAKIEFEDLVQINDILITTGGVLMNRLEEKKTSLSMFSLIVVDECHHAMKDHPYNMIMVNYLRMKNQENAADFEASESAFQSPQIVGLTASPGTGGKSKLEAAKQHILTLCANLDAQCLVSVQDPDNKEELRRVSNDPGQISRSIPPRNPDPFKTTVQDMMTDIEIKANIRGRCQDHGTQPYENMIMEERLKAISAKMQDVAVCCDHLDIYNNALRMSNDCRMADGLKIIDDFYNERVIRRQHENSDIESWLYGIYRRKASTLYEISTEEDKYPNPKLDMLKVTLQSEMADSSNEFRGMIFVKMRNLAKAICEYTRRDVSLKDLKADILTGVRGKSQDGQMTQAEQDATIQRFANGDCKLLVATSVAEEGLDIQECRMVINYNHATNEISLRQSHGRARKKQSTRHFIGDADVALRDKVNIFLDQQMEKAVEEIQNRMPKDDFYKEVLLIQNFVLDKRNQKEEAQKQKKSLNEADSVKLYCKGCPDNLVCQGSDVSKFETNHILIDADIVNTKVEFREHRNEEKKKSGIKKIYCKSCKQDWGNTLPPPQCFPVIKIASFIVEYSDGSRKRIKQWKNFPVDSIDVLPFPKFTVTCV
ncbi:ATP-dependent RNA helicase DHX58-like [Glandiceps talaboti]